jgi:hypothetical protein
VQASTSTRYKQALLEAPAHIASKILAIEQRVKQRFTTIITDKTEYYMHIPHSVVCIFAQYMGFSVEECKRALRECFLECDNITDKMKNADSISVFYFSRDSVVSQQLYQIANGNLNLQDCPEAFVEMQERAFASNVARYIEAEHKKQNTQSKEAFARASQPMDVLGNDVDKSSAPWRNQMRWISLYRIGMLRIRCGSIC